MLNFRIFLLANSFSMSRPLWMAVLPSCLLNGAAIWCKLDESALVVSLVRMWNPDRSQDTCLLHSTRYWPPGIGWFIHSALGAQPSKQLSDTSPDLLGCENITGDSVKRLANFQINTIHWRKVFLENTMILSVTKGRLSFWSLLKIGAKFALLQILGTSPSPQHLSKLTESNIRRAAANRVNNLGCNPSGSMDTDGPNSLEIPDSILVFCWSSSPLTLCTSDTFWQWGEPRWQVHFAGEKTS